VVEERRPVDRLLYRGVFAALALTLVSPFLMLSSSDALATLPACLACIGAICVAVAIRGLAG
jgi:hypothetical protein